MPKREIRVNPSCSSAHALLAGLAEDIHVWVDQRSEVDFLRSVLSRYCGIAPDQLGFEIGAEGRPSLSRAQNFFHLSFNLSHSGGTSVVAVARGFEVGIDIERVRPVARLNELAERFFFVSEQQSVLGFTGEARLRQFFGIWTAKEAWAKARGESVFRALSKYEWRSDDVSVVSIDFDPAFVGHLCLLKP